MSHPSVSLCQNTTTRSLAATSAHAELPVAFLAALEPLLCEEEEAALSELLVDVLLELLLACRTTATIAINPPTTSTVHAWNTASVGGQ